MKEKVKIIAFYLPQFHTIPENDNAHGVGFTEWTNMKKARPLFNGHYQPRIPLNNNYYCLLDAGVMASQARLAKKYGIYGFCYYHYWLGNGKKLLEKPIEMMLHDKSIDIPFCLCWANESWKKKWDGGNNEIIINQIYNDLDAHLDYLLDFFRDDRYIKIDGKPIFVIYRPEEIPNLSRTVKRIRKRMVEFGFPGVVLMAQYPKFYYENIKMDLFDNYIQFQPHFLQTFEINNHRNRLQKKIIQIMIRLGLRELGKIIKRVCIKDNLDNILEHRSYEKDWNEILDYDVRDPKLIAGAFPDWDNTPRSLTGVVYDGSTPKRFETYMRKLVEKVKNEYNLKYIFINAWNEWAEGAYLEPDEYNKYGYLEALKNALEE